LKTSDSVQRLPAMRVPSRLFSNREIVIESYVSLADIGEKRTQAKFDTTKDIVARLWMSQTGLFYYREIHEVENLFSAVLMSVTFTPTSGRFESTCR
jgi:hypothetical protein